jgi:P-type conjugative transfer protein TrbJ
VDQASEATFQLSGQQLKDLENAGELQNYINGLLQSPDGQMKAIQSGNQLATIQIQEARQLRELMATTTQSSLASQMKTEKESQMETEQWKNATKTTDFDSSRYNEPLP